MMMRGHLAFALLIGACATGSEPDPAVEEDGDLTAGQHLSEADIGEDGETDRLRARVCATGPTTFGIDVSYWQGQINWPAVAADGVKFAFIRVSDGATFKDPKFATNWEAARTVGIIRGAYQFFRPNQDPIAQANLMITELGGSHTQGDLPPVIDVEATGGLSPAGVSARVRTWVNHVRAQLGVEPIVYTGKYFWRDNVGSTELVNNPLWIAQYTTLCPDLPAPWSRWTFWQTSSHGKVAGIAGDVDTNWFDGDYAALTAFAGGGVMPPPPPPPTTCHSATLDRVVPEGTCVQAASSGTWFACDNGVWIGRSSSAGCGDAYAWCSSATLGKWVPPRTCVQAASDAIWYQCSGKAWATPVNTATGTGPAGMCSTMHAL